MNLRTGYIPDPLTYGRTSYRASREGISALPSSVTLLPYAPHVFNQNDTGSCTGGSTGPAIYTALLARGTPLPWVPSPKGIYTLGRAIDRTPNANGSFPPLRDEGAMPNQVMRGISEWGVRRMGPFVSGYAYDCDHRNVNEEPNLLELEEDAHHVLLGQYVIRTKGAQRIVDLCSALAAKKPITVALAGGSALFQSYAGGVLPMLHAPLDHYVWLYGYTTDAKGKRIFLGRNSWGTGWGEGGNFRLSEDAAQELGDIVVLDVHQKGTP
jgi:hypothetical protein